MGDTKSLKTPFRTDTAAPWPPRKKFVLTGPGKSWMKVTFGAFWARASRDKVTSELAWPREESAETFRPGKSSTLTGPSVDISRVSTSYSKSSFKSLRYFFRV